MHPYVLAPLKKPEPTQKEWSSFPPATLYYASPSATLTARGRDARTHQPMRHPANTAPYHARHSFHIPHHAALQHAIAPALHHGGNGAYLDTSQHSCTRHPCIYIACTFPMARRAASDLIPTCRASCSPHCSGLSFAFSMLLSFLCRMLLSGECEKPTWSSTPSFATPSSSATSASRASPPSTSGAPADHAHHPRLAPLQKLTASGASHRARHHTGRLKSPAERPRRGACRRLHVSRRCT